MADEVFSIHGVVASLRDDGIFHMIIDTHEMTSSAVIDLGHRSIEYCEKHAPVRYLVEVVSLNFDDLAARWKMVEIFKEQRPYIFRTAIVGLGVSATLIGRIGVRAAGRSNVEFFTELAAAEKYLLRG